MSETKPTSNTPLTPTAPKLRWLTNTDDPHAPHRRPPLLRDGESLADALRAETDWLRGKVLGEPRQIPGGPTVAQLKAWGMVGVYVAEPEPPMPDPTFTLTNRAAKLLADLRCCFATSPYGMSPRAPGYDEALALVTAALAPPEPASGEAGAWVEQAEKVAAELRERQKRVDSLLSEHVDLIGKMYRATDGDSRGDELAAVKALRASRDAALERATAAESQRDAMATERNRLRAALDTLASYVECRPNIKPSDTVQVAAWALLDAAKALGVKADPAANPAHADATEVDAQAMIALLEAFRDNPTDDLAAGKLKSDIRTVLADRDSLRARVAEAEKANCEQGYKIAALTTDRDEWKREWEMYVRAWTRELGGTVYQKTHLIDALVLTTKKMREALVKLAVRSVTGMNGTGSGVVGYECACCLQQAESPGQIRHRSDCVIGGDIAAISTPPAATAPGPVPEPSAVVHSCNNRGEILCGTVAKTQEPDAVTCRACLAMMGSIVRPSNPTTKPEPKP